jgi:hypothetical protein
VIPAAARLLVVVAAVGLAACGPSSGARVSDIRGGETMALRISFDPSPAYAREKIQYRVVVQDRESGQPIENGWGQVYATSRDGKSVYDNLVAGTQLGAYFGSLNFLTSGTWAVAVRFRRDSLAPLETVEWMQEVHAERNPEFPSASPTTSPATSPPPPRP